MPPGFDGAPLVVYLADQFRHSDGNTWRERIQGGELQVDDAPADPATRLRRGQVVTWRRPPWHEPDVPLAFAVLHRDPDCLAVAKPAGLPTQPAGGFLQNTLQHQVKRRFPGTTPVHRLGRGTSGVVLFARTDVARRELARAFREHHVEKTYRALVQGHPERDRLDVDVAIGPVAHPVLGEVHAASEDGKEARSRVEVLERRPDTTLVEVQIETGRPHQIRVHLAAAGHPLSGDPLYEVGGRPGATALPGDVGYHLHALRLVFPHPVSWVRTAVNCPPPPVLQMPGENRGG